MIPGMMGDDEKKIATVIVGIPEESNEEPADLVGLDTAVEEIMDAIKAGDKKAFKDALKSFIYMCEQEEMSEEEEY